MPEPDADEACTHYTHDDADDGSQSHDGPPSSFSRGCSNSNFAIPSCLEFVVMSSSSSRQERSGTRSSCASAFVTKLDARPVAIFAGEMMHKKIEFGRNS